MLKVISPAVIILASCLASHPLAADYGYDCSVSKAQVTPEGQPVDAIAGLRLGMSLDDVRHVLSCEKDMRVSTDERPPNDWSPLGRLTRRGADPALSDNFMIKKMTATASGQETIRAWFVGGYTSRGFEQDRLFRIEQIIRYERESAYPIAEVIASISDRYGAFETVASGDNALSTEGVRAFAPTARPLTTQDRQYEACWRMGSDYHGARIGKYQKPRHCGLTVYYAIRAKAWNHEEASEYMLAVTNPVAAWDYAIAVK